MAEMIKHDKINSTVVEETCFVNIPEDKIKLENTEIQGKLDSFHFQGVELRAITHFKS